MIKVVLLKPAHFFYVLTTLVNSFEILIIITKALQILKNYIVVGTFLINDLINFFCVVVGGSRGVFLLK